MLGFRATKPNGKQSLPSHRDVAIMRPTAVRPGGGRLLAGLCAAVCGLVMTSCVQSSNARRPNVLLITIDTLRADHLSCYGYPRATSPFIDTLASRGTLFENAYATSSWTAPAMASIFTGLYPRQHGVLHGFVEAKGRIANQETLSADFLTLAELLRDAGYTTFGVSSNGHMTDKTGFDQGFDHFTSMWFAWSPAPNRAVENWSSQIRNAVPWFLWVHYFDPHGPYFARRPWIGEYAGPDASLEEWAELPMEKLRDNVAVLEEDPGAHRALVDLYDSEINYADEHLAALFGTLALEQDTVIILTSDHGEEFLDHGYVEHGHTLYEEVVRVPLILVLPESRTSGRSVREPVSNRNIMPTVLDYLGLEIPTSIDGDSLLPLVRAEENPQPRPVFTELDRGVEWKAMRLGAWKFMCADRYGRQCYLFDLVRDPDEQRNLLPTSPDLGQRLGNELFGWVAANPVFRARTIDTALDEKQEERLRSLGYVD
jgi:arylsulfatase A-like enzyme